MSALTHGSLFSGVGGIDFGAHRAGFAPLWTAEIDHQARAVLRRHFPEAEHLEDVRHVEAERRTPTLLSGGFPCQDLSVAGKRAGLAGGRSGLWFEFRRIIAEVAPPWVLIENVPGLLSSNGGEDFAVLLEGLAGWRPAVPEGGWGGSGWIGPASPRLYGAVWRVLDTRYFGVPQRRRRVFVVAHLGGFCPPEVLLEPEGLPGHPQSGPEAGKGPSGEAGGGTDEEGVLGFDWQGGVVTEEASATLGTDRVQVVLDAGVAPSEDDETGSSPTLKAGGGVTVVGHARPASPRRLTPVECERLQGFPDGWTEEGTSEDGESVPMADTPRDRMMGNAVSVPVAEWICRRIAAVHCGEDPDEAVAGLPRRYLEEVASRSGRGDVDAEAAQGGGSNAGPPGALRGGSGSAAGGVPFVVDMGGGKGGHT